MCGRWPLDSEILREWNNGLDTYEIARKHFMREDEVHRRLIRIRERERSGGLTR